MRLVNQVIEDINKAKKINLILTGGNSPQNFMTNYLEVKLTGKKLTYL